MTKTLYFILCCKTGEHNVQARSGLYKFGKKSSKSKDFCQNKKKLPLK